MKKVLLIIATVMLAISFVVLLLVAFIESKKLETLMYICMLIDLVITLVYNTIEAGE